MKLLSIFLLFSFITYSQNNTTENKPEFNKIGYFSVNQTTSGVIKNLEIKYDTKTVIINDKQSYTSFLNDSEKIQGLGIYQIIENQNNLSDSPPNAPKCPNAKIYKIKGLEISDILIEDLSLTFYEDTLINVTCSITNELLNIVRLKYGKGQTTFSKDIECTKHINGKKVNKYKISSQENWFGNGINSQIIYTKWQCLDNLEVYKLGIYSNKFVDEFLSCEKDIEEKREAKRIDDF